MRTRTLILAIALDWLLGDPPNALHPVAWFGKFIRALERRAPQNNPRAEFLHGAGIAASGIAIAAVPVFLFEQAFGRPRGSPLQIFIAAIVFKMTCAWRALIESGEKVRRALERGHIEEARAGLRALVSRDASQLDSSLIAAATIESLAENASDSFVAPLFYYQVFGLSGAVAYRAVNTMDAMLGYHGRFEFLGKFPARLDDALNFIPSRLTALLIVVAARSQRAWQIWRSDRARTASPNAGQPMSAMAGALDVRLEKIGHYVLNESGRAPEAKDIQRAAKVVNVALVTATLIFFLMSFANRKSKICNTCTPLKGTFSPTGDLWSCAPRGALLCGASVRNRKLPIKDENVNGARHDVVGWQESPRRRAVPHFQAGRFPRRAVQSAEHGAQFVRDA